jgi:hypothetical protein
MACGKDFSFGRFTVDDRGFRTAFTIVQHQIKQNKTRAPDNLWDFLWDFHPKNSGAPGHHPCGPCSRFQIRAKSRGFEAGLGRLVTMTHYGA